MALVRVRRVESSGLDPAAAGESVLAMAGGGAHPSEGRDGTDDERMPFDFQTGGGGGWGGRA